MLANKHIEIDRYLIILLILVLLPACSNENKNRISGSYPVGAGQTLAIELFNMPSMISLDSVKVKRNGQFSSTFELQSPELVLITNEQGQHINLLLHPGEQVNIGIPDSLFSSHYTVEGSPESQKVKMLVLQIADTRRKLDSVSTQLQQLEDPEDPRVAVLNAAYNRTITQQKQNSIRFIVQHLNSLSSVYALYQRLSPDRYVFNEFRDLQYLKIVADSLKLKYPESSLVKTLITEVRQREEQYNTIQFLSQVESEHIKEAGSIDLAIRDRNNDLIRLSDFRGKPVLLNFWASRNRASIDANRNLKTIYEEYHEKGFEVYSVSLDNNASEWLSSIRFEEYAWIDVCELTYPDSYAASSYNIQSLPSNFLIDGDGNIIARNIGGRQLKTWLDNIL